VEFLRDYKKIQEDRRKKEAAERAIEREKEIEQKKSTYICGDCLEMNNKRVPSEECHEKGHTSTLLNI